MRTNIVMHIIITAMMLSKIIKVADFGFIQGSSKNNLRCAMACILHRNRINGGADYRSECNAVGRELGLG